MSKFYESVHLRDINDEIEKITQKQTEDFQAPIFNLWPRGVSVFMASSFIKDFHTRCHFPFRMSKHDDSSRKTTEILFFVFLMHRERLIVVYQMSVVCCYSFSVISAWKSPFSSLSSNMLTSRVFVDVISKYGRWLTARNFYEPCWTKILFCFIYTY